MKSPDLSIIIPALAEATIIGERLEELSLFLKQHPELGSVEVIVVAADGGDETATIARAKAHLFNHLQVIEPGRKVGKGRDVRAGMLAATGAKRIFTDADFSTPLQHILDMSKALDTHDVVIGVRDIARIHTGIRTFISQFGNLLIQALVLPGLRDSQCGFKGFRAEAAERLFKPLQLLGWGFDLEILAQARRQKMSIKQLNITDWHEARAQGLANQSSIGVAMKSFAELIQLRFRLWGETIQSRAPGLPRICSWLAPIIAVGVGAVIYMHKLGTWSLWFDEAYTAHIIRYNPSEIINFTAQDVHPPLYYLALQAWTHVFGNSEVGLRSLSVACALAAMVVGYILVRRLFGQRAAYITLPFVLLAPFLLRYGQEARMYGLASLICVTATYVFVRAIEAKRRVALGWWALYALLVAAGMYTHYYTALVWIGHWVWRWYMIRQEHRRFKTQLRAFFSWQWILLHVGILALFAPWLPSMLRQLVGIQAGGFWIGPVGHQQLLSVITEALVYEPHWMVLAWLSLALIIVAAWLGYTIRQTYVHLRGTRRNYFVLLLIYALGPIVLLFVLSLPPLRPALVERYFAHTLLGLYLLIGVSFALAPRARQWYTSKIVFGLATLALFIGGICNIYTVGNYNYNELRQPLAKEIMAHLQQNLGPNEAVIANSPYLFYEINYYQIPGQTFFYDTDHIVGYVGAAAMIANTRQQVYDLAAFGETKPSVWCMALGDLRMPIPSDWHQVEVYELGKYKAVHYLTSP